MTGYDSPIQLLIENVTRKMDEELEKGIFRAAGKIGIEIDKEKLIQALKQDRERYEEAWQKGYTERDLEIVRCSQCKYGRPMPHNDETEEDYIRCVCPFAVTPVHQGDWFCAEGKRREEDYAAGAAVGS